MPELVKRQRTISGQTGNVKAPISLGAEETSAVAGVGRAIGDIGEVIAKQREHQRVQDRKNKSIAIGTAYDDEQRSYYTTETQFTGSDAFGNIERAEKFRMDAIQRYTKDIDDPELKTQISQYIENRSGSMMDALAKHQAAQRNTVSLQAREGKINSLLKDSYESIEPVESSIQRWEETIRDQREAGLISEEEAVDIGVKGQQQIAEANLDGIINRNPEQAIELINSGVYDKYLPQKKIKEFDKQAKELQKAMERDRESKAKEREKAEKDALKEKQREIGNQFVTGITDGSLTLEQIIKSPLEPTGENSKEHWMKELEKRDKKVKESVDEEWKTNPEVEADFIQKITENPESVKDSDITDKLGEGLGSDTAKQLLAFRQKRLKGDADPVKEQEVKTAIKRLSDAKTSRFFDPRDKVNNSKLWAENVNNIQRYIKNHPDEDINLYVDQILAPVKESWTQHIFDLMSFGAPGKEEATRTRQEELRMEAEDPKKIQARKILEDAGKPVTDKNIEFVMGKL